MPQNELSFAANNHTPRPTSSSKDWWRLYSYNGMRYISLLSLLCFVLLSRAQQNILSNLDSSLIMYEEVRPDYVPIGERSFLILWKDAAGLHGRFNTTTDEFETAREGYTPGYVLRPMEQLTLRNDTLFFTCSQGLSFQNAIPLYFENEAQVLKSGNPLWCESKSWMDIPTHPYWAVQINPQSLILYDETPRERAERIRDAAQEKQANDDSDPCNYSGNQLSSLHMRRFIRCN